MIISRILAVVMVVLLFAHLLTPAAAAHPLGNFTISHYAGLHLDQKAITIDFVLDMAEIPAFQEIAMIDANDDGQADIAEAAGYHAAKCESIQPGLILQLDGRPLPLNLFSSTVEFPPGAGGLPTLRLSCNFYIPLPTFTDRQQLQFSNNLYGDRLGWREIVVTGDGVELPEDLTTATGSISRRLTAYPEDLLANPLDQRQISLTLRPVKSVNELSAQPEASNQPLPDRNDSFTQLMTLQNLTPPAILLALAIAFAWGAAHALTPGHGKTIVAAYLVGSRGTVRHALFLGLITTITHTAGVFLLGFLTLFASRFVLPEQLYPWLGAISGTLVAGVGLSLFRSQLQGLAARQHEHHQHDLTHPEEPHADYHHHHGHDHHHDHGFGGHSHLPPEAGDNPVTWRSLLALGVSGGLIPCPSALIVMLSAIALQRIGFGLVLIVAFSLGLAGVLTLIGVLWVQARQLFEYIPSLRRWSGALPGAKSWLRVIPAASALFITIVGLGITLRALLQTGVFL